MAVPLATKLTTYQKIGSQRVITGYYSVLTDVDPVISLAEFKALTIAQYNQRADALRAKINVLNNHAELNDPAKLDSDECNPIVIEPIFDWHDKGVGWCEQGTVPLEKVYILMDRMVQGRGDYEVYAEDDSAVRLISQVVDYVSVSGSEIEDNRIIELWEIQLNGSNSLFVRMVLDSFESNYETKTHGVNSWVMTTPESQWTYKSATDIDIEELRARDDIKDDANWMNRIPYMVVETRPI